MIVEEENYHVFLQIYELVLFFPRINNFWWSSWGEGGEKLFKVARLTRALPQMRPSGYSSGKRKINRAAYWWQWW